MRFFRAALFCLAGLSAVVSQAQIVTQHSMDDVVSISRMYRDSKLFDKAKEVLIDKFTEDPSGPGVDRIYYELGVVLFLEGEVEAATTHWGRLLQFYPNSSFSEAVSEILRELSLRIDMSLEGLFEDLVFEEQIKFSVRLWNYKPIDQKTDWSDLQDPWRAYQFYKQLLAQSDAPEKRLRVLYLQFLLVSGQNSDKFGFKNADSNNDSNASLFKAITGIEVELPPPSNLLDSSADGFHSKIEQYKTAFRVECERLLTAMEAVDSNSWRVADGYFRMGVLTSGSAFWSGDLRVNKDSAKYFERVLALTPASSLSYRRVFAAFWLGEFDQSKAKSTTSVD